MGNDECKPVSASRRIDAPVGEIFKLLADPDRHPEFDGSGMLQPGAGNEVVAGVGDVFVMKMYFPAMGDYEMHHRVVGCGRIGASPGSPATGRAGGLISPPIALVQPW